jgi:unsaturated chondroitin disaccharide hydrolase
VDYLKALSKSRRKLFTEALDLLAAKLVEDEAAIGVEFPYVTEPDGAWRTMPASLSAGYSGPPAQRGRALPGLGAGTDATGGAAGRGSQHPRHRLYFLR